MPPKKRPQPESAEDAKAWQQLREACVAGDIEAVGRLCRVDWLKRKTADDGYTLLHTACDAGHAEVAELLLTRGAAIDELDRAGCSALAVSCSTPHTHITDLLLRRGAAKDGPAGDNVCPPLCVACEWCFGDAVRSLLACGANPNKRDADGRTPLHVAAALARAEIAELLIRGGADVDGRNGAGATVLHTVCAAGNEELARLLLSHGADKNARDVLCRTPLYFACKAGRTEAARILLDADADVHAQAADGTTALHAACSILLGVETVELLLRHGAVADAVDGVGRTPLYVACKHGYVGTADALLLEARSSTRPVGDPPAADVAGLDVACADGNTPLHAACLSGNVPLVQSLLDRGADKDKLNYAGKSARHLALTRCTPAVADVMSRTI